MVMWKYVFPLLQLEILVKGCVVRMSCRKHSWVVGGQVSDLVLGDELLQDPGDVLEVRLVLLKLHPVDQRRQLEDLLPHTAVVAAQKISSLSGSAFSAPSKIWSVSSLTERTRLDGSGSLSGSLLQLHRRSFPRLLEFITRLRVLLGGGLERHGEG
ncbi:hypothetical protein EYF80_027824 [Liparis tanakae]|uniref:Uncharacterized protein n=1 Tax=Liparis tanakae TaxID=230148 RepID=A0A4Z2H848_9TELE|nr:hypothetical protein EYF80_027824 [Liparis tanakae]